MSKYNRLQIKKLKEKILNESDQKQCNFHFHIKIICDINCSLLLFSRDAKKRNICRLIVIGFFLPQTFNKVAFQPEFSMFGFVLILLIFLFFFQFYLNLDPSWVSFFGNFYYIILSQFSGFCISIVASENHDKITSTSLITCEFICYEMKCFIWYDVVFSL